MSEKYIDLKPTIAKDTVASPSSLRSEYQAEALKWLDEHPDQVPGRTITESEFREGVYDLVGPYTHEASVARRVAEALGVTVVPDPEPTRPNVPGEKFQARLFNSFDDPTDWMVIDDSQVVRLSDGYLIRFREFDAHWKITKAPGGDDE